MSNEVENLLKDKGIYYRISGSDFLIGCLNPEHEDSNPSLRIDRVKGIGHCFSCGYKTNIFKHFGIITNMVSIKVAGLKEKLRAIKNSNNGLEMLEGYTPMNTTFRGISAKTFKDFDMFYTDKVKGMEDRIILPMKDITGNIKAFVGRHVLSNGNPKYMVMPNSAPIQLVPPSFSYRARNMILVEGMFDMLNLYDKGIRNAVAVMGTQTVNNDGLKLKLLPFKAQGVSKIFLIFDGDKAGEKGSYSLKTKLESYGFIVEIIPLPEGQDPGDMSQEDVDSIIEYINDDENN